MPKVADKVTPRGFLSLGVFSIFSKPFSAPKLLINQVPLYQQKRRNDMKKCIRIALITFFILSVSSALCFGQLDRTVTNTSKKGSLLIWPLIKVGPADTTLMLSNDFYKSVKVKCFYRKSFPFSDTNWIFNLMPNQTISWLASTGKGPDGKNIPYTGANAPPLSSGSTAELRCWAVDSGGTQQIAWNWLSGSAIIKEGMNQSWGYSAWRFAVNSSTTGATAGSPGQILLTGDSGNYDSCPTGLMFNFLKQTSVTSTKTTSIRSYPKGTVNNNLTLIPCYENFKTNGAPNVFTDLPTYDEDQTHVLGASVCVGSTNSATHWFSEPLTSSKLMLARGVPNPFFNLATPGGSIYIHGKAGGGCAGNGVPLIGVMSMQFMSTTGPIVGVPPTAIGPGQAYVRDAADDNTSTPISITW
jgi:hypothetical protein